MAYKQKTPDSLEPGALNLIYNDFAIKTTGFAIKL
jgi:hypothetical protein